MQLIRSHPAQLITLPEKNGVTQFKCSGDWTVDAVQNITSVIEKLVQNCQKQTFQWDVSDVGRVDSAGIIIFYHYYKLLKSRNCSIILTGVKSEHKKMFRLLRHFIPRKLTPRKKNTANLLKPFNAFGHTCVRLVVDLIAFITFMGEIFVNLATSIIHPGTVRYGAIVKNIEDAGVRAMPIIAVTSFLIGIVIAYQGAVQLQKFGANIFIVDMIGISITRELAPLITAIVVAGRTGSSYTAQLGAMKITEEIDAMRTMGFDPYRFLIVPRILALMIALPLLVFFADIVGILAGMLISDIHLNVSPDEFFHRLQSALAIKHVWIGIFKAPFFAWLIASVGCFYGLQVSSNTESIGRYTTISVVNAIFLVIACDALFSVLFTELGI